MNFNLFQQRGRTDDRGQRGTRRVVHEAERDVAQNEVQGVVYDVFAAEANEEGAKDCGHDDHHEEWIENAPQYAEEASTILEFEVFSNKLLEDVNVLFETAFRVNGNSVLVGCSHWLTTFAFRCFVFGYSSITVAVS